MNVGIGVTGIIHTSDTHCLDMFIEHGRFARSAARAFDRRC